jgi:hypothetical protein
MIPGMFVSGLRMAVNSDFTAENKKISLVDGAAFIDFGAASIQAYIGSLLLVSIRHLYWSPGREDHHHASGYIKAAGSAETLDSNIVTGWTNSTPLTDYPTLTTAGADITRAYDPGHGHAPGAYSPDTTGYAVTVGKLYKLVLTLTMTGGQVPILYIYDGASGDKYYILANGVNTIYLATGSKVRLLMCNMAYYTDWAATFVMKQVLTPSATGVTIVSKHGGATQNWKGIESEIYDNSSLPYHYKIYYIGE